MTHQQKELDEPQISCFNYASDPFPHEKHCTEEDKFSFRREELNDENQHKGDDYRLPTSVKPHHYLVKLQPFINGNFSIKGYVEILIEALEPASNITVHVENMTINTQEIKVITLIFF